MEFNWADITGATDYTVNVLSGQTGTYTPPGNYFVDGLIPGEEVNIEVIVNGNTACDLPVVTLTCVADGCPDVLIDLTPVDPICADDQTLPIQLEAIVTGSSGNGTGIWSGVGVVNGQFDATEAGVGVHILTYTFEENAYCIFSEEISVEVVAPPIADAGKNGILSCADDEMEVELGGNSSSGNNISYNWQYNNGPFPGDSTILKPNRHRGRNLHFNCDQ